jgi:hypothetical protein
MEQTTDILADSQDNTLNQEVSNETTVETHVDEPVVEQVITETKVEEPVVEQVTTETKGEESVAEQVSTETKVEETIAEQVTTETKVEEPVAEEVSTETKVEEHFVEQVTNEAKVDDSVSLNEDADKESVVVEPIKIQETQEIIEQSIKIVPYESIDIEAKVEESLVEELDEKETLIEAPKIIQDIPTYIAGRINPNITNILEKYDTYSFCFKDAIHKENGYILFKIPHLDDVYWTNFKYSANTLDDKLQNILNIAVVIITADNEVYEISVENDRKINEWYDTEWALPSINISDSISGFYLRVKPESVDNYIYDLNITILGFKELYPKSNYYMLFSPSGLSNFILIQEENTDGEPNTSIYNLKKYAKIHYIIHKLVNIKRIKNY